MINSSSKDTQNIKQPQIGVQWVNNKYTLIHKIHEGVNSKIFVGAFMKNSKQISRAIKISPIRPPVGATKNVMNMGLKNEINVLRNIFTNQYGKVQFKVGFPRIFEFGAQSHSNYIVMSMLGPNLGQLMKLCSGKFSLRTTLLIGLQIMDRLQDIHQKKYLYGGMCPQNFMVGINMESYLIYMTDFGKSTVYKSKTKDVHIPYQQTNIYEHPSYDHNFMSLNCQLGIQGSRRDDIEAFMYLLFYMYKGRLPWYSSNTQTIILANNPNILGSIQQNNQSLKQSTTSSQNINVTTTALQQQRIRILEIKRRISAETLFKSLSFELIDLMNYTKTLSFYEKPDYNYIRKKLWGALMETDYQELRNNIVIYDWNVREPLDYEIYRDSPKFKLKVDKDKEREQNQSKSLRGSEMDAGSRRKSITNLSNSAHSQNILKARTSFSSRATRNSQNLGNNERRRGTQVYQEKKNLQLVKRMSENDKIKQDDDDANVIDEDQGISSSGNDLVVQKIDEKLKIINGIDEDQMNGSAIKTKAPSINNQSRFKSDQVETKKESPKRTDKRKSSYNSETQSLL